MYKKLMPSHAKQRAAAQEAKPEERESTSTSQTSAAFSRAAEPSLSAAHSPQKPHKVNVPALDSRPTEVINVMEEVVLSKLEAVLSRFQCCRCDRCKKDIVALALNKLPPKYMVLSQGQNPPDIDAQTNAQVVTAMIQAVIKVRAHPRH
ncbi:MAG: Late competence development protein ComFB [Oscillospiraceae bacterium]